MTPSDALFWYTETAVPAFRPIIAGLYVLDRHPRPGGIEAALDATVRLVPRLGQRVVEAPLNLGLPEYVDDRHFDPKYHLRHVSVAAPGRMCELLELTASLMATPLDRERPLWEAYWIDGLDEARSAFFLKMHHSLVDGVGALAILRGLAQSSRREQVLHVTRARRRTVFRATSFGWLGRLATLALDNSRAAAAMALDAGLAPVRALGAPRATCRQIRATTSGLLGVWSDARQAPIIDPLARGAAGISRRFDVLDVPLKRLRDLKTPLGGTINDVVLTALAGAVGHYHRQRGVHVATLNCMVPMSLRAAKERDTLGNRVGMSNISLPVGETSARRRFAQIVEQTRTAKRDRRGALYPVLVRGLTLMPGSLFAWLAPIAFGRVNLVCTNIPGIDERRYMAGAEITAIYPFASPVEGTPLVVALLSYAGTMHVGIDTDPDAIPDPRPLSAAFHAALDELEALATNAEESAGTRPARGGAHARPLRRSRRRPAAR
jgi:diacylglycerol O-acyltransferase